MARFRGTDKAECMDQRQVRGPAFRLLEEAELFCQRHFPLPAKIVPGEMRRIEKHLIPPDAMRDILVNATSPTSWRKQGCRRSRAQRVTARRPGATGKPATFEVVAGRARMAFVDPQAWKIVDLSAQG